MKKVLDHAIEVNAEFVLGKKKIYPLSREEREEMQELIKEQLRKEYICYILFQLHLSQPMNNLFSLICIPQSLLVQITYFYSTSDVLVGPLLTL